MSELMNLTQFPHHNEAHLGGDCLLMPPRSQEDEIPVSI